MKKSIVYIELILLLVALSCCFIPCVQYKNDLVIDIYVFDANKIMGYTYMILLIVGIVLRILAFKKDRFGKKVTDYITNILPISLLLVTYILYLASALYRRNVLIHFGLGFYILTAITIIMIIVFIIKMYLMKNKKTKKI